MISRPPQISPLPFVFLALTVVHQYPLMVCLDAPSTSLYYRLSLMTCSQFCFLGALLFWLWGLQQRSSRFHQDYHSHQVN